MDVDKDHQSIAEAGELIERAHAAWQQYRDFSQAQVDAIVDAMAEVATAHAERLAYMAVDETTYGKPADKLRKNLFSSQTVYAAIRGMRTVGVLREDAAAGIVELGTPVGVVAAILPCTNPTSTAIYKILIALKAGNGVVLSPHPAAMRCICETVGLMRKAAMAHGAPADLIGCFSTPTLAGTEALMKHRHTKVVLATGGMSIVRAAYSSGKPAFGVGPGNVPAFVDRSARLEKAVADIVAGKSFDWGTICSSEQALVAEADLRAPILERLKAQHAYLLSPDEAERLGKVLINPEHFTVNSKCVGQSPQTLAAMAGFGDRVPASAQVLVAELDGMGKKYPLSAEQLSPVLALYFMPNRESAFQRCADLLHFGGLGHTCVIHSQDDAVVREYGRRMPAFRVVVNSPSPLGSIGATTNLFPAMTLGCGAAGGNITSDNIGPQHLMNVKRIAWEQAAKTTGPCPPQTAAAAAMASACACQHEEAAVAGFVPPPLPQKAQAVRFVCEADVRDAFAQGRKIAIGPRTIITPAARDLGRDRNIFESGD